MAEDQTSTQLTRKIDIEGVPYFYMPIDVAIKYAEKISSGFFVPLNEKKRVRIEFGEGDLVGKMNSYRDKGLEYILLAQDDYYSFLKAIKSGLIGFFLKDDENSGKSLGFEQCLSLVKKAGKYIGLDEMLIDESEEMIIKVYKRVKNNQSIYMHVKPFILRNQDEFLKNTLISYIGVGMVTSLDWPPALKEKVIQTCLLCDIFLKEKDYLQLIVAQGNPSQWTKNYFNHPQETAKFLQQKQSLIGREVVRAVEQHHELPDGTGFPLGVGGGSIEPLSAIVIVARAFIDKLVESDFSYDNRRDFIDNMLEEHFSDSAKFNQACKALYILTGLEEKI